jgi:AhpC/TSA family
MILNRPFLLTVEKVIISFCFQYLSIYHCFTKMSTMIEHLENHDFTQDGRLKAEIHEGLPVFVMIQSSKCYHCTVAKPEFVKLYNEFHGRGLKIMTISGDGKRQSEIALINRITTIYPGFIGYPAYMLFLPDGRKLSYNGERDAYSLSQFLNTTLFNRRQRSRGF